MKRMILQLGFFTLFLLAANAFAAGGGPPNQGTLFSGQGLDWQRTATEAQQHWHLQGKPFPPTGTVPVGAANIKLLGCTPISGMVARCRASALLAANHNPSKLCGKWLDPSISINLVLYAFSGYVDTKGAFVFEQPLVVGPPVTPPPHLPRITFACGLTTQTTPLVDEEEWSALGALGKCMDWPNETGGYGYPPAGVAGAPSGLFQSCIRMVRGDYCGDGVNHTKDGTLIDPYLPSSLVKHVVQPAFMLEANWNEFGAICIIHARYVSLSRACQDKFNVPLDVVAKAQRSDAGVVTGMRGSDYWCRNVKIPIEPNCPASDHPRECPWFAGVRAALSLGFLLNDSLLQP